MVQKALNIIETFGTYSGLKVNKDKSEYGLVGKNTQKKFYVKILLSLGERQILNY